MEYSAVMWIFSSRLVDGTSPQKIKSYLLLNIKYLILPNSKKSNLALHRQIKAKTHCC